MTAIEHFHTLSEHVRKMVISAYNLRNARNRAVTLGKTVATKRFTTQHERIRRALAKEDIEIPS